MKSTKQNDDLCLIQVTEEDDSILQSLDGNLPDLDVNSDFSPFKTLIVKGETGCLHGIVGQKIMHTLPGDGDTDKENIQIASLNHMNVINQDESQSKRRKRVGGCNPRKSLAWDKAFFMEEGVLNPLELSLLERSFSKGSKNSFSKGTEDRKPLVKCSNSICGSPELQDLEKTLFNKVSEIHQEEVQKPRYKVPKSKSSIHKDQLPLVSATVGSTESHKRNDSQGRACSLPQASYPSYVPTSSGNSKPPKMITAPSESSFASVTSCSESANPLVKRSKANHNIPQVNPVKKVGLRSSLFHSKDSVASAAKSSVGHSSKDMSNQTSGTRNCVPISKFCIDSVGVDICEAIHCDASDKVTSLQQIVHNSNKTIFPVPIHAKPSGLRMPSPSHRYFDKENVSLPFGFPNSTISSLQRNTLNHYTEAIPLSNPIEDYSSTMNRPAPIVNYGNQVISPLKCSGSDGVNLYLHPIMKSDIDSKRSKNMSKNKPPDSANHSKPNKDVIWGKRLKPENSIKIKPISYQDKKLSSKTDITQEGGQNLKKSDNIFLSSGNHFPIGITLPPDLSVDNSKSLVGKKVANIGAPSSDFDQAYEISQTTSGSKNEDLPNDNNEDILKPTKTFSNVTTASSNKSSQVVFKESPFLDEVKEGVLPGVTHISLSGSGKIADEVHYKSQNGLPLIKNENQRLTVNDKHNLVQVDVPLHQQLNAAPFSDEWIAAFEAVGEDILTRKTGAVHNSPPDKSIPPPGPWSPVRRNNQGIGPNDCTKYRNLQHSGSRQP